MATQTLSSPGLKGFKALGVTTGFEAIPPYECKICLSSRPGRGKSTFAMSIPGALVIDYDHGAREVLHQRAHRIDMVSSATQPVGKLHGKIMTKLLQNAGPKATFKTIVFDTLDAWFASEVASATVKYNEAHVHDKVQSILDLEDYGKARSHVYDKIVSDLTLLSRYGYGWIVLGHISPTVIRVPGSNHEITTWGPSLGGKLPGLVYAASEIVGSLDRATKEPRKKDVLTAQRAKKDVPQPVTQYVLTLGTNDDYQDAKSRLRMPETEIVMPDGKAWDAFTEVYEKAMADAEALASTA